MMPPPMTSIRLGIWRSSSAPVESTMRGSLGTNGRFTTDEPAAMMACLNCTTFLLPSAAVTSMWLALMNWPTPVTTCVLRALAMPARPPVIVEMTSSLCLRTASMSICGAAKLMPCLPSVAVSSITEARCSKAFDGMQPTFRQTPPSGAERGRVTARTAAEDHHVAVDIDLAAVTAGHRNGDWRCRCGSGGWCSGGSGCGFRHGRRDGAGCALFHRQQQAAFGDLVADLDCHLRDQAGVAGRNLHAGLVRFHGDQRLVDLDRVADLDHHFDHFDFLEVADVRDFDFYCAHRSLLIAEFCACRRALRSGTRRSGRPSRRRRRGGRRTARCPSSGVAGRPCRPRPA